MRAWAAAMARAWGLVHLPPDRDSAARVLNTSKPASRPSPTGNAPNFPHPTPHPKACAQWLACSEAWHAQVLTQRPAGTGRVGSRRVSTPCRDPHVVVRLGGAARKPTGCASHPMHSAETSSAEHALPRISLGLGGQSNAQSDRRGPGQLAGWALRPSTGPARPQPMRIEGPAETVCRR